MCILRINTKWHHCPLSTVSLGAGKRWLSARDLWAITIYSSWSTFVKYKSICYIDLTHWFQLCDSYLLGFSAYRGLTQTLWTKVKGLRTIPWEPLFNCWSISPGSEEHWGASQVQRFEDTLCHRMPWSSFTSVSELPYMSQTTINKHWHSQ